MRLHELVEKRLHSFREYCVNMDPRTRLRWGMAVACILLAVILLGAVNGRIDALEKKRKSRESDLMEMMTLKQRFLSARLAAQRYGGRTPGGGVDVSPSGIIEEIGIKGKSSRVTPLKGEDGEDAAEAKLEGLTANEAVNLLYRLEKGGRPVVVKKANLKTCYDDPARLDITLTIAVMKPAPQGQK